MSSKFFKKKLGMETMNEKKGKGVVRGEIEEEAINQSRPPALSTMKLVLLASSERKKTVSKRVDTGNLRRHRGNKKQKVDPLATSTPLVVVLDHPAPVAKFRAGTSPTLPGTNRSKPFDSDLMTLLKSEGLA